MNYIQAYSANKVTTEGSRLLNMGYESKKADCEYMEKIFDFYR